MCLQEESIIRPMTFYMASLMAHGIRVLLTPSILGCIYHALSVSTTHPHGINVLLIVFPMHYIAGRFAEHFIKV